jgi:hypothetical protein
MRSAVWWVGVCLLAVTGAIGPSAYAEGEGLQARSANNTTPWPQWQLRLQTLTPTATQAAQFNFDEGVPRLGAARITGDRYFSWGRIGDGGGLRASGGVLLGATDQALAAPLASGSGGAVMATAATTWTSSLRDNASDSVNATPYLGMGYTTWWARHGLSIAADLGVLSNRSFRLGKSNVDSTEGSLRADHETWLSPVLQVQLSYAF